MNDVTMHLASSDHQSEGAFPFVTVYDSIQGSGKTYGTLKRLAENLTQKTIIAFPTKQLAAEAEVLFKTLYRENSKSKAKNKHDIVVPCGWLYQVDEEDTAEAKKQAEKLPNRSREKEQATSVAQLFSIRLDKFETIEDYTKHIKALENFNVIFTTHRSLLTLATKGFVAGREIIIDESPDGYMFETKESKEELQESILDDSLRFSEDKAHLVDTLNRFGIIATKPLKYNSFGDDGRVFESYSYLYAVDLSKFLSVLNAKSVTILTAQAKSTDCLLLSMLSATPFKFEENPRNRELAESYQKLISFKINNTQASASKLAKQSGKSNAAREEMKRYVLENAEKDKTLAIAFNANKGFWRDCFSTIHVGVKGLNTYSTFENVVIDSLWFPNPKETQKLRQILGSETEDFISNKAAALLMQAVYRTAIRKGKPIKIFLYDDKALAQILSILHSVPVSAASDGISRCKKAKKVIEKKEEKPEQITWEEEGFITQEFKVVDDELYKGSEKITDEFVKIFGARKRTSAVKQFLKGLTTTQTTNQRCSEHSSQTQSRRQEHPPNPH